MASQSLPQQWLSTPLENVIFQITGGGTPSKSKPEYYRGDIPWMSVKDMNKHLLKDTIDHISPEAVENSSTNVIPAGTPIIATRMSLGKIVVANFDSAINQDLKALFLPSEIHQDYLVYWYRSIANTIEQLGTGTTVKGIRLDALKALEFALPPLAEQKVIADKLDTLLAQVDTTKARLERIPEILKRFRQSVLAAAVSGRLTKSDTKKWPELKIDQIVNTINGKAFPSKDYQDHGVKLIKPGNLHVSGNVVWNNKNTTYIPTDWLYKRPELILQNGALLMNMTAQSLADEFLGRVCVFKKQDEPVLLNQRICSFESKASYDIKPYLYIFFKSPKFRSYIDTLDSGTLIKHLNIKNIKSYKMLVPSEEEQTEIVRRVDQLFAYADTVERQVNSALERVNQLTQSILAKAFRGELTAQWREDNPDLISGDNSAEALLERIKAERAAKAPVKRTRKKATA